VTSASEDPASDDEKRNAARAARADRLPLNPERIFRTALDIITRDGAEALTMRRVASALDVEPMSLYHHVPSKKALLDGVAGMALSGVGTFDDLTGPWQDQVREMAQRLRRELLAYPRAATLIATRPLHSEQLALLVESGLGRLTALGFDLRTAADVLWTTSDFVMGNALNLIGYRGGLEPLLPSPEDSRRLAETFTPERFPNMIGSEQGADDDDHQKRFDRGLDALIAGIEGLYPTPGEATT
jgi:AcrR family transcriptional regulator